MADVMKVVAEPLFKTGVSAPSVNLRVPCKSTSKRMPHSQATFWPDTYTLVSWERWQLGQIWAGTRDEVLPHRGIARLPPSAARAGPRDWRSHSSIPKGTP